VAVKLAERAVNAVIAQLQADLATELAAIVTERADSDTLTAPATANYYNRPKAEIAGGTTESHIEVFEGEVDFNNPYTDAAAERFTYEVPITVRLTVFNRDGALAPPMATRMRRYGVGIANVFNKNHDLGGTDSAIQAIRVDSVRAHWDENNPDDGAGKIKVQTVVETTVKCEETQA